MEAAFRRAVEHIFGNWTALKLAVDHSMAGPKSKEVALECLDYMTQYCLCESDDEHNIQDALEDIMDQEFETICEDNSTKEIAVLLSRFLQLLRQGNIAQFEAEFNSLPVSNDWLVKSQSVAHSQPASDIGSIPEDNRGTGESSSAPVPMDDEDSEWTHVTSRRKR